MQQQVFESFSHLLAETGTNEIWVACSAGLDSMALLRMAQKFTAKKSLFLGVIHLNHNLRPDSVEDELFVADFAAKASLPLIIGQARNLELETRKRSISLETAARNYRYAFFQRLLESRKQALIVTAHQSTDQVETILMNLMRGTGIRGLKGIPQLRGRIGRPLLEVTRAQLVHYVNCKHLSFREDPTNSSFEFYRNRVRHSLLPLINELGGPGVETRIAGAGLRLANDLKIIDRQIDVLWASIVIENSGLTISRSLLQKSEVELVPHFLGRMIRRAGAIKQVSARVLDDLVVLVGRLGEQRQSSYDLGSGLLFKVLPETVSIGRKSDLFSGGESVSEYEILLRDYGSIQLPYNLGKFTICLTNINQDDFKQKNSNPLKVESGGIEFIDADKIEFPLIIRNRRPGDRFQPLGFAGHSCKLKKFMNGQKLSHYDRLVKPIVCDCNETIIWVVGERLDYRFRISEKTCKIAKLSCEK